MRSYVWVLASPRDERRFATTRPPAGEWVEALKKDGYVVMRVEFEMPATWDPATDALIDGLAKRVGFWTGLGDNCERCLRPAKEHVSLRCPGGVIPGFDVDTRDE